MVDWTIRKGPAHPAELARIRRVALDGLGFVPTVHSAAEDTAFMAGLMRASEIWIAEADGPVGFAAVTGSTVDQCYVLPDWQRRGVGSALLAATQDGRTELDLFCFQQNTAALAFYARHGFREISRDDQGLNEEGLPDVRLSWRNADLWAKGAGWVNGKVVPLAKAKIHAADWGVTRSDITYDVASVWEGAFFRLDDYVTRFFQSMASLRLDPGVTRDEVKAACHAMVAATGLQKSYVAMVASRGTPAVPGTRDPRTCRNHFYAWCVPYIHVVQPDIMAKGASLWVAKDVRRIPEDSVNPLAKNYHWGDMTAGLFEAKDQGFETVVLLDHAGNVTEGPGFNVFAVKGDRVVTSDHGVLHGITRRTVLEMASAAGMHTEERPLPLDEFLESDEIMLSTTGGGVVPVTRVDDRIFSNGAPGPVATELRAMFDDWRMDPRFREDVVYA